MPLTPGETFGGFVIESRLGAGGMGEVYRAFEPSLQRTVALKVLRAQATSDPEMQARFVREARAAASITHPNVVTIYRVGEVDGVAFMAMEILDGITLRAARAQTSIPQRLAWALDLARALEAVHAAGFVHRDVKPDNVLVTNGTLKLLDFGIAKRDPIQEATLDTSAPPSFATETGSVMGTPRYMAPEQGRGAPADPRTDQFAWGLVVYELLGGEQPVRRSPGFSAAADWSAPAKPLVAALPDGVSAIVMKALARDANERFPSMTEIIAELERITAPIAAAENAPTEDLSTSTRPPAPKRRTSSPIVFLLGVLVVMLFVGAVVGVVIALRPPVAAPVVMTPPPPAPSEVPTEDEDVDAEIPPAPPPSASNAPPAQRTSKHCACATSRTESGRVQLCVTPEPTCTCHAQKVNSGLILCPVPWSMGEPTTSSDDVCSVGGGFHVHRGKNLRTGGTCRGFREVGDGKDEIEGFLACLSCARGSVHTGVPGAACRGVDDDDGTWKVGTWRCKP